MMTCAEETGLHDLPAGVPSTNQSMDAAADLSALQKNFDVTALGCGEPIVGFNLLASMACTLAHLAPDDGTVVHPDGSPARLGTSLLVLGSANTGRVVDEIITEVSRRQNNLVSHLQGYFEWLDRIKETPGHSRPPSGSGVGASVELIAETQSEINVMCGDNVAAWRKVLERLPHQTIRQIEKQPKFLVSVGGRKDIESQLTRLRPGCPLVHLGLSHPNDLALFSEAGSALLEGRYPLDDARTVRGNILVTDPMHVLIAAAQNPDERTSWLGQLLWLTDGDSGPDAPHEETGDVQTSSARIEQRFRLALGKVMTYRLGLPDLQPLMLFTDTREASARWAGFLREMEPRLPGISGAARNLLTSLVFGLGLMAPKSRRITLGGIEAMARFLVRRMASARIAILHAGDLARKREQITRVFHKLGNGPVNARKLCRHLSISAGERDDTLRWLEATGLIVHGQDGWQVREGARLCFTNCTVPILEV